MGRKFHKIKLKINLRRKKSLQITHSKLNRVRACSCRTQAVLELFSGKVHEHKPEKIRLCACPISGTKPKFSKLNQS